MQLKSCIGGVLSLVLGVAIWTGCQRKPAPAATEQAPSSQTAGIPVCQADSLWAFVKVQTDFGPRIPNSPAQKACADWLLSRLESYGAQASVQEFTAKRWDGENLQGRNIIASFQPENPKRVLLCAHWDSRPYADNDPNSDFHKTPIEGANDGASGTAVLLEIARVMQRNPAPVGVDIVLFDLEDSGKPRWAPDARGDEYTWCLGSQYWAENPHIPGYSAWYGILLDMVGTQNPCFTMEATSMYYAPDVMRKVWGKAALMGFGHIFQSRNTGGLIDDHLFINRIMDIPTIDIVHYDNLSGTGFFPHWHTVGDSMENLSASTLKTVGDVVLAMLYE
ncbi:MAG: M28 family peptidase [Bacteroidales bacterium]|nr:M28 family peptidase [Bacteroidales bacterium]